MAWRLNPFRREKRRYKRYGAKEKVFFHILYEFKTRIIYQIIDRGQEKILSKKYSAVSKDISAEGLCFVSSQKLGVGDRVRMEVYIAGEGDPVVMDGEVRWCKRAPAEKGEEARFSTGLKLIIINKKPVEKTIYVDQVRQVVWSDVLETVVGKLLKVKRKRKFWFLRSGERGTR
ncbi:MAG: PilZ domain-containing protein [Candidatus Omnitrophota bacterium]